MTSDTPEYTTKELSTTTWADFERLFQRPAGTVGDGWWCWCTFHHISSFSLPENKQSRTRAERAEKNRRKKRALVEQGSSHGILVYANGDLLDGASTAGEKSFLASTTVATIASYLSPMPQQNCGE